MDAILQLFAVEEILDRLGQRKLTGCFHAFTPKESASILFKEGLVVAAIKAQANGQMEGEEVITEILGWTDARYLWQPNSESSTPPRQPLQLNIREFLAKTGAPADPEAKADPKPTTRTTAVPVRRAPVISISAKGKTTGSLEGIVPPGDSGANLAATKILSASPEERAAQDEALLRKHKFALVAGDESRQRYPVTRVSSLIGRSPACAIILSHPSISRQHSLLQITERGLLVKDMGTTNGTKVNGILLKEGYINPGDKLSIGHLDFVLEKE